ncbi:MULTISPECIES: imidazole glycerol phosphate synthase subunit HisH [Nitrincola]|uniref:Imidazole glycerol phosphate synthase subunit HisH n=1 Tax=Nitrincola nitratireducens TaxID=1229521 RepID=W9UYG5_9GAMM|nr:MULTISPECIES: imidazole glycerol phosphate synthase subunit HisH [Nitrincola]EXJ09761.1 Imidazole glycerol phosphate synthase subunit HisH 1 [Nitrincola nitratireducens]
MIRIVDYGVGNIQAFLTLFKRSGIQAERASTPEDLKDATRLVIPGVGHFDHAMQRLNDSGMRPALDALVLEQKVPVVGVCVGMQMLAEGSDEGRLPGLGWIPGRVRAFADHPQSAALPMPHMGWNTLEPQPNSLLFSRGFDAAPQFYFLHSYYFDAADKKSVAARAQYGLDFDAVVSQGHIHGVQCHPEKSHHWGVQLLKNFAELS